MAKESVAILKGRIDVSEVLDELNAALSEEWLRFINIGWEPLL